MVWRGVANVEAAASVAPGDPSALALHDPDLVIMLDLRPTTGPANHEAVLFSALGVGALAWATWWALSLGFGPWSSGLLPAPLGLAGLGLLIAGGTSAANWAAWRNWLAGRRGLRDMLMAAPDRSPGDTRFLYEWEIRNELGRFHRGAFSLASALRRAGLPSPRAIAIGPPDFLRSLPDPPPPDLVEPEMVRSFPGRSARRGLLMWLGWAAMTVWCLSTALIVGLGLLGNRPWPWPSVLIGNVFPLAFVVLYRLRTRGYSALGGAGLIAAPSHIEWHGVGAPRVWTAADTTLVVLPSRFGASLVVRLDRGADPRRAVSHRLYFYGVDDPGFQTLWRMWLHPMSVEHLADAPRAGITPERNACT